MSEKRERERRLKNKNDRGVRMGNLWSDKLDELIDRPSQGKLSVNLSSMEDLSGGYDLLVEAFRRNRGDIARHLLLGGAKVNNGSEFAATPLHYATRNGDIESIKMLLDRGAVVDAVDGMICNYEGVIGKGSTPLYIATGNGDEKAVEILIKYGADVNCRTYNDMTPLHLAAYKDYPRIAEFLLQHGAEIHSRYKTVTRLEMFGIIQYITFSYTALYFACRKGHEKVAKVLLKYGAEVDAKDKCIVTPLGQSPNNVTLWTHYRLMELRMKYGNEISSMFEADMVPEFVFESNESRFYEEDTTSSQTALLAACQESHTEVVDLLLRHGADVNISDRCGMMPLCIAAFNGNSRIVEALLKFGAGIDSSCERGELENNNFETLKNAFRAAYLEGHENTVTVLLKHGADINCRNGDGMTPLLEVARKGYARIADILIKFGAEVNSTDDDGQTALQFALKRNWRDTVLVLLENGADINKLPNKSEVVQGHTESSRLLVQYIVKMRTENLFVKEIYLQTIDKSEGLRHDSLKCEAEIEKMKKTKIGNSTVTFYNILTKDVYQIGKWSRSKDIADNFEGIGSYTREFPVYADAIHYNFSRGKEREGLLRSAIRSLNNLFGYELPDLFAYRVMIHLSHRDLINLQDAYPDRVDESESQQVHY